MKDNVKKVAKAHTRYYTQDGTLVPGSTTICGLLNKPVLIKWANNLGLQGIDSTKYVDETAKIGTLIHYMVECYLTKQEPNYSEYNEQQIDQAKNGFIKFLDWYEQNKVEVIFNEKQLVSETYKYGGTLDFYCKNGDNYELIDFKSGKGIYKEYFMQVSSYANMLRENGYQVDRIRILNIGRDETESFKEETITKELEEKYFEAFKNLLNVYYIKKELNWN